MFSRLSVITFLALGLLHGGTILVSPAATNVVVGQSFEVDVDVSSVSDLYAYQFDLSFDPAVLQATSVTEGSFLEQGGATLFFGGAIDNVDGLITTNADTLETAVSGVSGGGILVEFGFQAIAPGTSQNEIANLYLLNSNLDGITADTASGNATVSTVSSAPEPSSLLLLFGGGLFILGWMMLPFPRTIREGSSH